jgi:hypothetical protein
MRNIEEKMAAFTDAGLYEQDAHIDFEPDKGCCQGNTEQLKFTLNLGVESSTIVE